MASPPLFLAAHCKLFVSFIVTSFYPFIMCLASGDDDHQPSRDPLSECAAQFVISIGPPDRHIINFWNASASFRKALRLGRSTESIEPGFLSLSQAGIS
jgi:hypothetical protein